MRKKQKILLLIIFLSIIFCGIFTLYFISEQIKKNIKDVQVDLSELLDNQVAIDKVTTEWQGYYFAITLKDVLISDKQSKIPLLMLDHVQATVDWWQTIIYKNVRFNNLFLNGLRVVLQWSGETEPTVLGLSGEKIPGKIDLMPILEFLNSDVGIKAKHSDIHIQNVHGKDLPLMDMQLEFSKLSNSSYKLYLKGLTAEANPRKFEGLLNYQGDLLLPHLSDINYYIWASQIYASDLKFFFPDFSYIHDGIVNKVKLNGKISKGDWKQQDFKYATLDLQINSKMHFSQGKGELLFDIPTKKFNFTGYDNAYTNDIWHQSAWNVDKIEGHGLLRLVKQHFELSIQDIKASNKDYSAEAAIKYQKNHWDIKAAFSNFSVNQVIKQWLPDKVISQDVIKWLDKSFKQGYVKDINYQYSLEAGNTLTIGFSQADLQYSLSWPMLSKVSGNILLSKESFRINLDKSNFGSVPIKSLHGSFEAVDKYPYGLLNVEGVLANNIKNAKKVLADTQLSQYDIFKYLDKYAEQGKFDLQLRLGIPLVNIGKSIQVAGEVNVSDGVIKDEVKLENIKGKIKFVEKDLAFQNVEFDLNGSKFAAEILSEKKSKEVTYTLNATGNIRSKDLKKWLPTELSDGVLGETVIKAEMPLQFGDMHDQQRKIIFSSDLEGLQLDFPEPLVKKRSEKIPTALLLEMGSGKRIKFAEIIIGKDFISSFSKIPRSAQGESREVLVGKVQINDIDLMPWIEFYKRYAKQYNNQLLNNLAFEGHLKVGHIELYGIKLDKTDFRYTSVDQQLRVQGDKIQGQIFLPNKENNLLTVNLDKLLLDSGYQYKKLSSQQDFLDKDHPLIIFNCKKLQYKNYEFQDVQMKLLPRVYGYEIEQFDMKHSYFNFTSKGQWDFKNESSMQLAGELYSEHYGKLLSQWDFGKSIDGGMGNISFSIKWPGMPWDFSLYQKADGVMNVDLMQGSIVGVNSGLGRIIGLLSLESIQRRIQLDFSDVTKKSLFFNSLKSTVHIQDGILSSDSISIVGPSARIELFGKTWLKTKELGLEMYVIPKVGAGLPIAAALAVGNPAVGIALWLADQASGSKMSEIMPYHYQVMGTWEAPVLKGLGTITESGKPKN